MYAIRNKRTKKWLFGTWYQDGRRVQRTSYDRAMTFETRRIAEREMMYRQCGKAYEVVQVVLKEI